MHPVTKLLAELAFNKFKVHFVLNIYLMWNCILLAELRDFVFFLRAIK